jgi:hypothetical protein
MRAWIKRPQKPTEAAVVQRMVLGITAAEMVPTQQIGEVALRLTLANSTVVETNPFKVPTIKAVKAIEKLGGIIIFEVALTDGRKFETNALQRLPASSPTVLVAASLHDTLFATTFGVQLAVREKIIITWDNDYSPANSGATKVLGPLCIVERPGRVTVQVGLRLLIKKLAKGDNAWLLRLCIVRKHDSWLMGETKIRLPFDKDSSPFDAGVYRFENLPFDANQAFEVVLQCLADEKLYMGLTTPTTLELMWWPPPSR